MTGSRCTIQRGSITEIKVTTGHCCYRLVWFWKSRNLLETNNKKNHITSQKLYRFYYPHRLRELMSPVCRIFGYYSQILPLYQPNHLNHLDFIRKRIMSEKMQIKNCLNSKWTALKRFTDMSTYVLFSKILAYEKGKLTVNIGIHFFFLLTINQYLMCIFTFWYCITKKIPAYRRHRISWWMRIEAPVSQKKTLKK